MPWNPENFSRESGTMRKGTTPRNLSPNTLFLAPPGQEFVCLRATIPLSFQYTQLATFGDFFAGQACSPNKGLKSVRIVWLESPT
jgi:hypothetical protein